MFKKLKEKKGFTLVELIVVLVILAILAALLIPALTKYIDKAKEKSITAETRQVVMAAQTLVDEKWAGDQKTPITIGEKGTGIKRFSRSKRWNYFRRNNYRWKNYTINIYACRKEVCI